MRSIKSATSDLNAKPKDDTQIFDSLSYLHAKVDDIRRESKEYETKLGDQVKHIDKIL